ncbi:hypothetical protein ACOSQ3_011897 [Xanthoceras sorbifolium]
MYATQPIYLLVSYYYKEKKKKKLGRNLFNFACIVFDHVSFKYPNRPDVQIFKDLCLSIPSGKTIIALVGESGSGKSTVISLLERF